MLELHHGKPLQTPNSENTQGLGKITQLRHNLDTASWVEKLNINPRLCSYLIEQQKSLNFKVLKDVSIQLLIIPVV